MEFFAILIIIGVAYWLEIVLYRKYAFHKLEYRCYFSTTEAWEGDEITLVEEVSNGKLLPLPWLKAELTTSRWLDFAGSQSLVANETRFVPSFFMMKSHHKVVRSWKVKCLKRGVFHLDKVILISSDLFGGVSLSQPIVPDTCITVLPRPADMELGFEKVHSYSGSVVVRRHLLPDPFLIAGVREYTQRESMNRIHWLATARTGCLMVHNNEYSADQTLTIILNVQSREGEISEVLEPQKTEDAIRACAGFLDDTLRSGIPAALMVNTSLTGERSCISTGSSWGRQHVHETLRLLAQLPLVSTEHFPVFLSGFCRKIPSSDLVLITPYLNQEILSYAYLQQEQGIRVKIVCISQTVPEEAADSPLEIYLYWGEHHE